MQDTELKARLTSARDNDELVAVWVSRSEIARALGKRPADPAVSEAMVTFLRTTKAALAQPAYDRTAGGAQWLRKPEALTGDDALFYTYNEGFNTNTSFRKLWFNVQTLALLIVATRKSENMFNKVAELNAARQAEHVARRTAGAKTWRETRKAATAIAA